MIAGAAERQRQAEARQQRQHFAELNGVLGRELARDPAGVGVVDHERRLHAGKALAAVLERGQRGAQLLRVRAVLRVVDDDEFATRAGEADIERFRLRARRCRRNDYDFNVRRAEAAKAAASVSASSPSTSSFTSSAWLG